MTLVDTSVWIDHLRRKNAELVEALGKGMVYMHPHVLGELALSNLQQRKTLMHLFQALPQIPAAENEEVLYLIEKHRLMGRGIGWIDAHLLAACRLHACNLWTRDKRLQQLAKTLGVA